MEEENQKKIKNLQAIKEFFERDMKIKETLLKLAPSGLDEYDELSRMDYVEKLEKALRDLEYYFVSSIKKFDFSFEVNEAIKEYFNNVKQSIYNIRYTQGVCQKLYISQFSNMDKKFIEEVKQECAGYTFLSSIKLIDLMKKAKTVNELLHVMHSFIVNNEMILKSMPEIGQKENKNKRQITLYGEENEIAKRIFEEFPLEMDCGITDIISLKNKILMMVRDRGHALTIDMDTSKDDVEVKYFIPKLCNEDMIRKLPGINPSSITNNGASGFFVSSKEEIAKKLFGFIEKVPTDLDMLWQYSRYYNNEDYLLEINKEEKLNMEHPRESENKENIFSVEDAKSLAIQLGEDGRKISKIEQVKNKIIISIRNLKEKFNDKVR